MHADMPNPLDQEPFTMNTVKIVVSGVGGQGTLLASRLLAESGIRVGLQVRIGETYGMSQRGGPVMGHVQIGSTAFGPLIRPAEADAILGFEIAEAVRRGVTYLKKGDLLFFGRKGSQDKPERITHVGIYLANREFIHSPGGAWIRFNSFDSTASDYSESLRRSFVRARRYIGIAQVPEVRSK
jgi:Pyruvate/2-oxoacid:ferredoxin oxidoreductase gamma subunit